MIVTPVPVRGPSLVRSNFPVHCSSFPRSVHHGKRLCPSGTSSAIPILPLLPNIPPPLLCALTNPPHTENIRPTTCTLATSPRSSGGPYAHITKSRPTATPLCKSKRTHTRIKCCQDGPYFRQTLCSQSRRARRRGGMPSKATRNAVGCGEWELGRRCVSRLKGFLGWGS